MALVPEFREVAMHGSRANVGIFERWASALVGCGLLVRGVDRPSAGNTLLALLGMVLAQRAITGHCAAYAALGLDSSGRRPPPGFTYGKGKRGGQRDFANRHDPSSLSFPASDPPPYTAQSAGSPAS